MKLSRAIALVALLGPWAPSLRHPATIVEAAAAEERYSAHGVVKSFGPKRAFVNIAHERIPGYIEAMTMSFEPRSEAQLAGLEVGARVAFAFTVTADEHRLLDSIAKE